MRTNKTIKIMPFHHSRKTASFGIGRNRNRFIFSKNICFQFIPNLNTFNMLSVRRTKFTHITVKRTVVFFKVTLQWFTYFPGRNFFITNLDCLIAIFSFSSFADNFTGSGFNNGNRNYFTIAVKHLCHTYFFTN